MKLFTKTLFVGGLLMAAGASQAANISISYDANAEADFLASLNGPYAQETFDSWTTQGTGPVSGSNQNRSWVDSSTSFSTNVGTFTLITPGQENSVPGHPTDDMELKIESRATGEFGREALASSADDFWMDSNDALEVEWDFTGGGLTNPMYNAFGFYIADPSDVSATLTLTFDNGTVTSYAIPFVQTNAKVGYVTVTSADSIVGGKLTFDNSDTNDGWGIDDITVGHVPEPGTLLLMGLGLLGLGAARRRTAK